MSARTFDATRPLVVDVDVSGGSVLVTAADTDVAVVDVKPVDPSSEADVKAAEQTVVELAGDRLRVAGPRRRGVRSWFGSGPGVRVTVDVPRGSRLVVDGWADVRTEGPLDDVQVDDAMGDVTIGAATSASVRSAMGDVVVGEVEGAITARTASGAVRLRHAGGDADLRTSAGDVVVGTVGGALRARTAMGDVRVDHALGDVVAKTSSGDVRVGEVTSGVVRLDTSYGAIEVGVPHGTAAWLDLDAKAGSVLSDLDGSGEPGPDDPRVSITARTGYGSVHVRRAAEV